MTDLHMEGLQTELNTGTSYENMTRSIMQEGWEGCWLAVRNFNSFRASF